MEDVLPNSDMISPLLLQQISALRHSPDDAPYAVFRADDVGPESDDDSQFLPGCAEVFFFVQRGPAGPSRDFFFVD